MPVVFSQTSLFRKLYQYTTIGMVPKRRPHFHMYLSSFTPLRTFMTSQATKGIHPQWAWRTGRKTGRSREV